MKLRKRRKS